MNVYPRSSDFALIVPIQSKMKNTNPTYSDQREIMFAILSEELPNICNMNDREQLSSILNCKINKSIRVCAKNLL